MAWRLQLSCRHAERIRRTTERTDAPLRAACDAVLPQASKHMGSTMARGQTLPSRIANRRQLPIDLPRSLEARVRCEAGNGRRRSRRIVLLVDVYWSIGDERDAGAERTSRGSERTAGDLHPVVEDRQGQLI